MWADAIGRITFCLVFTSKLHFSLLDSIRLPSFSHGDPLSIAGSAVGVISLGLQVCGGLLSYYKDFKSYNYYGDRIHRKLGGLQRTLQCLEKSLKDLAPWPKPAAENVRYQITSCEAGFQALKETWEECEVIASSNTSRERMQSLSRRLAFPFKKSKVQDVEAILSELQQNLDTALQTLLL